MKRVVQKRRMVMAPKGQRRGLKGFASMDEEKKKGFARKGGLASARTKKTSNRGFASMDKTKLKQISSMGGKASKAPRTPQNEEDAASKDTGERAATDRDLSSLEEEDDREASKDSGESLEYSETDEDEDEGLGDGNLGRSTRGDVFER